jgi:plastocyanin
MNSRFFSLALALSASALASCGDNGAGTTEDPAAATVVVTNNKYTPAQVTVKAGQIVEWQFNQGVHDVTSGTSSGGTTAADPIKCTPDGKFASGEPQGSGKFRFKFTTAGTYPYFCTPHCDLKQFGSVVVTP